MKNKFFLLFIFFINLSYSEQTNDSLHLKKDTLSSAITWLPNNGRFGDHLVSYSRAKWISYKYNIPLIYREFDYSNHLKLHTQETIYTPEIESYFSNIINLPLRKDFTIEKDNNTLYMCQWKTKVNVNWADTFFIEQLKQAIAINHPLEKIIIPDDCISIAVHVRTGGAFTQDTQIIKDTHPLRFTPIKILIAQAKRLIKIFDTQKIYIHIFTDHPEPSHLIKKFQKQINDPRVSFGYREQNNSHDLNVLEDFFSMMEFDCIIRPQSHFSLFAQRLGKSKIAIYPASISHSSDIDAIMIQERNNEHEVWVTKKIIPVNKTEDSEDSYEI